MGAGVESMGAGGEYWCREGGERMGTRRERVWAPDRRGYGHGEGAYGCQNVFVDRHCSCPQLSDISSDDCSFVQRDRI